MNAIIPHIAHKFGLEVDKHWYSSGLRLSKEQVEVAAENCVYEFDGLLCVPNAKDLTTIAFAAAVNRLTALSLISLIKRKERARTVVAEACGTWVREAENYELAIKLIDDFVTDIRPMEHGSKITTVLMHLCRCVHCVEKEKLNDLGWRIAELDFRINASASESVYGCSYDEREENEIAKLKPKSKPRLSAF